MFSIYKRYQTPKFCAVEADHVRHMAAEQMARTICTLGKNMLCGKKTQNCNFSVFRKLQNLSVKPWVADSMLIPMFDTNSQHCGSPPSLSKNGMGGKT